MSILERKLAEQIPERREEVRELLRAHGDREISSVTVAQAYGGMRGVKGLICDTSLVEPDRGLLIRGYPIQDLVGVTAEECFHLLLTGERPTPEAIEELRRDWLSRSEVPGYVWDLVNALPRDTHPMTLLSMAVLAMQRESRFAEAYDAGISRDDYWKPTLEDALNLLGRLPAVAAGIYRHIYEKGDRIAPNPDLDWGAGFAHMLGTPDPTGELAELMRMFAVLHSDHEGGNVSAHTSLVVGSALSDAYQAISAGLNGLAGPLHGLANQQCLRFVLSVLERFGGVPTDEELADFCRETLSSGQVIPGYGHAVLRCPDPRFVALFEFGAKKCSDSEPYQVVEALYRIVPEVLREQGKAKNPWPNVDASSGSLLYHYGLTETRFYTVYFGVSRAMGMAAQLVLARAMGFPIERPKSVGTKWVKSAVLR